MIDVEKVNVNEGYVFLNTGSPHHIQLMDDLPNLDVKKEGAAIRYSNLYGSAGSNINFVSELGTDKFAVRTYERGVEDETLSCGTGVTAVAIAMREIGKTNSDKVNLKVEGGDLAVTFEKTEQGYKNVFLIGPATFVFKGEIEI